MTNYANGHKAEEVAAKYLEQLGYKIIERNYRTRMCEIDIVAKRRDVIYFIEVKYRLNAQQGAGLDYITDKKLRQMRFGAEVWLINDGWNGDYRLSAINVDGIEYTVTEFIESVNY